jgi:hypothetical protein
MRRPYAKTKVHGRTIDVHVKVWTDAHGPVPDGHVVHHKNHNKRDNRLENLQLMTHAEHSRHHNDRHPRERSCDACGGTYEPPAKHRGRSRVCSQECRRVLLSGQRAGSGNGIAKLTEDQVAEIRQRLRAGAMGKALAAEYGVGPMAISRIRTGQGWTHVA